MPDHDRSGGPAARLAELVWTGDDGWVSRIQARHRLSSIDFSPGGQYVVFASDSEYGAAHHLSSYHADLGWEEHNRREVSSASRSSPPSPTAAKVVAMRTAGFEDEPGAWFGGVVQLLRYDAVAGRWGKTFTDRFPSGGAQPVGFDVAKGRLFAAYVRSKSTGRLNGKADRLVLLRGQMDGPRRSRWATGLEMSSQPSAITERRRRRLLAGGAVRPQSHRPGSAPGRRRPHIRGSSTCEHRRPRRQPCKRDAASTSPSTPTATSPSPTRGIVKARAPRWSRASSFWVRPTAGSRKVRPGGQSMPAGGSARST